MVVIVYCDDCDGVVVLGFLEVGCLSLGWVLMVIR